jgi:hypothetical protein
LGTDVKGSVAGLETRLKRATGSLALIYVTPANYRTCAAAFRPSCRSASRARVASAILSFPLPSWERVARIELARYEPDEGERTLGDLGKETPHPPSRQMPLGHPLPQGEREFIASSWPGLSRPSRIKSTVLPKRDARDKRGHDHGWVSLRSAVSPYALTRANRGARTARGVTTLKIAAGRNC